MAPIIVDITNLSIIQGQVQQDFKLAGVTPLHKKGNTLNYGHLYRTDEIGFDSSPTSVSWRERTGGGDEQNPVLLSPPSEPLLFLMYIKAINQHCRLIKPLALNLVKPGSLIPVIAAKGRCLPV